MVTTTRSGRVVKKPELFSPKEICDDDFKDDEYDSEDDSESEDEYDSEDEDETHEDADKNGNLKDFVVDDEDKEEA